MPWRKLPLRADAWPALEDNPLEHAGLVTTLAEEHDYDCEVEGDLPPVEGVLYRVGPGRYDRGPDRKRMMLDGDGMVQALAIRGGRARYRNRYVRTAKYVAEERAGRFLYPTLSTHGSGPLRHNLGLRLANQANTTVLDWAGTVWAFDEGQVPYALDAALETAGPRAPDPRRPGRRYWAHFKLDARHRQVHLLSVDQGPRPAAHVVSLDPSGTVASRRRIPLPRSVYFHDWFASAGHFAFLLHPAYLAPRKVLAVLLGRDTFSDAIDWRPERGGLLLVVPRDGGEPFALDAPPVWMWHAVNAWEAHGSLVCDFIGSALGASLDSESSVLFRLMRGDPLGLPASAFNLLRRLRVDLGRRRLDEEVLAGGYNHELPVVSATERGVAHTRSFMTRAEPGDVAPRMLYAHDPRGEGSAAYRFAPGQGCSEPVVLDTLDGPRGRFLATQVYDAGTRRSSFALFDEADVAAGPVASIGLLHHVPLSFHGHWVGGAG